MTSLGKRFRVLVAVASLVALAACGQVGSDPSVEEAERRAASMAAANDAASKVTSSPSITAPDAVEQTTPPPAPLVTPTPESSSSPDEGGETTQAASEAEGGEPVTTGWSAYSWPPNDDGKACTRPVYEESDAPVVVLLGDSLIRDSRSSLREALRGNGFNPVFVCWGGKTTSWGVDQLGQMADLGVTPDCLVLNLGTNDVKNEAASPSALQSNLVSLIGAAGGIAHVMLVNIWAITAVAPTTMKDVDQTLDSYRNAVAEAGKGRVIPWAEQARDNPGFIGDDGVHDTNDGSALRTQLIADAVASQCG